MLYTENKNPEIGLMENATQVRSPDLKCNTSKSHKSEFEGRQRTNVAKDDQYVIAKQKGTIVGTTKFKDVLYAPELRENFLSAPKRTNAEINVQFGKRYAALKM